MLPVGSVAWIPFYNFVHWKSLLDAPITVEVEEKVKFMERNGWEAVSPVEIGVSEGEGRIMELIMPGHPRWVDVLSAHEAGWHGMRLRGMKWVPPKKGKPKFGGLYDGGPGEAPRAYRRAEEDEG